MRAATGIVTAALFAAAAEASAGGYWHAPSGGYAGPAAAAYAPPYAPSPYGAPGYGAGEPQLFSDPTQGSRPCGPPVLNLIAPQSFFGADFRPACAAHDACYGSAVGRAECDARFRERMHAACANSRFPGACHSFAETRYTAVRVFGGPFHTGRQLGLPTW